MKRGDLVAGGEYAWRRGRHGDTLRCIVLDVEQHYDSRFDWPYITYRATPAWLDRRFERWAVWTSRRRSQRVLVAIEVAEYDDPADRQQQRVQIGTRWYPYAARGAEIVSTWAAELDRRATEAAQRRLADEARRIAEQQREIARQQRETEYAERARQREIEREQQRKVDAIRAERFEQRIEPVLRELGFAPERAGDSITLSLDDAERLSALLGRDVTADD